MEKLSSTAPQDSVPDNNKLAFLSPVYDPRPPPSLDSTLEAAGDFISAGSDASGLPTAKETREKAVVERWHQAAKLEGAPRAGSETGGPSLGSGGSKTAEVEKKETMGERVERSSGVSASGGVPKRARSLGETDISSEGEGTGKKARLGEAHGSDAHRRGSSGNGAKADTKSAASAELPGSSSKPTGGSKSAQDRARSKTPEVAVASPVHVSNPARGSSSKPPCAVQLAGATSSQSGGRQPGRPAERPRSGTPEPPAKPKGPGFNPVRTPVRPVWHPADGQKPLPKPHSTNNFLQFADSAKRATAPPRRNPEMRDPPQKQQSGVEQPAGGAPTQHANGEKQFHARGVLDGRRPAVDKPKKATGLDPASDDDLFDELDTLPRARKQSVRPPDGAPARRATSAADVSKGRAPVGLDSGSEPEAGLEEEDGFLSDSDSDEVRGSKCWFESCLAHSFRD